MYCVIRPHLSTTVKRAFNDYAFDELSQNGTKFLQPHEVIIKQMVFFKMSQQKLKESGRKGDRGRTSKAECERETHRREIPFDVNRHIPMESNTNY